MKKNILVLFILVGAGINIYSQTLPTNVVNHLNKNFAGWQPIKSGCQGENQNKWVFTGDFDLDGKTDLVISFGEKKGKAYKSHYVMAFLNQGGSYKPMTVKQLQSHINRISYGFAVYPFFRDKKDRVMISQCKTTLSDVYEYQNGQFIVVAHT